jgi:arsenite transporter
MGVFERFLTLWVGLSMAAGVALGTAAPGMFTTVARFEYAHVNLAVAALIWLMIFPMMIQIDWSAVRQVHHQPRGLMLTLLIN